MHARILGICWLVGTLAVATSALADDAPSPVTSPKWTPWVEFGGFYGSNDSSRGEAVLWMPLVQGHTSLVFGEARGKLFEDDMREGNVALGYRQMMPGGWNYGIWGGYDLRESQYGNTFHQLAGGIEVLSDRWDFRANAYLPFDDRENLFNTASASSSGIIDFTGTSIGMITTTTTTATSVDELALWGIDTEIGAKLFSTAAGANSLIIADNSASVFLGSQTLLGDQTLQGSGSTIQVRGVTSGIVVDTRRPAHPAHLRFERALSRRIECARHRHPHQWAHRKQRD